MLLPKVDGVDTLCFVLPQGVLSGQIEGCLQVLLGHRTATERQHVLLQNYMELADNMYKILVRCNLFVYRVNSILGSSCLLHDVSFQVIVTIYIFLCCQLPELLLQDHLF